MRFRSIVLTLAASVAMATSVCAADLRFSATLGGDKDPTNTGSKATGKVAIVVHTDTLTVDTTVTVSGIAPANFADHLEHAPVGPMHLHLYAPDGSVSLLLPYPMSPSYSVTPSGFTFRQTGYAYADGAKILQSTVSFGDFVKAMDSGAVVFNIHTDTYPDGEISGLVQKAS